MTTLITGVPGWLGNRLLKSLTDPNENLYKKYNKNTTNRKIKCLVYPPQFEKVKPIKNVEYIKADISSGEDLSSKFQGVDTVFHIAGIIHPKKIKELYKINTDGTRNVVSAALKAGVKQFIYVSSNSVSGFNSSEEDLFDEDTPLNPYLNYGKSKYQAEKIVRDACRKSQMKYTIIRPCWFYGPDQPARQTRFFNMIKKGNPIIFGNGNNLRSMSYVDNIVQSLLLSEGNESAYNQTFWIADEKPYKTIEIYKAVADIFGVTLKPRFVPNLASAILRIGDSVLQKAGLYIQEVHVGGEMNMNIACSIDKAKRVLNYKPEVSLKDGMKNSIEWCKKNGLL